MKTMSTKIGGGRICEGGHVDKSTISVGKVREPVDTDAHKQGSSSASRDGRGEKPMLDRGY